MKLHRRVITGSAVLAACAALGWVSPVVQAAATAAPTWTRQHPAVHPPARVGAAMAYDAATGTAVLFGGDQSGSGSVDTWTWNGTTWTRQAPAVHPSARDFAAMAYDAATSTVLLFGGGTPGGYDIGDTWIWG